MFTITFIFINNDRFLLQIVKHTVKPQQVHFEYSKVQTEGNFFKWHEMYLIN